MTGGSGASGASGSSGLAGLAGACRNCGAPLDGPYCSACGQEAGDLDLTLRGFLGDLLEHVASFDSRAWRTLVPLLFLPGQVTARYLAGQRVRFVPPVRLYFFVSLGYFLLLAWLGPGVGVGEGLVEVTPARDAVPGEELAPGEEVAPGEEAAPGEEIAPGEKAAESISMAEAIRRELEAQGLADIGFFEAIPRTVERIAENPEAFRRSLIQGGSYLMFFLLPAFALLLKLFYLGRRRLLLEHLLFAVHFHVFVFLLLGFRLLLERTGAGALHAVAELLTLALPVYLLVGLRRVYGGRWWTTALRTAGLGMVYGVIIGLALLALLAFVLVTW